MLGSGRLEVYCFDGQTRLAHIRGKLRKKVRLRANRYSMCGAQVHVVACTSAVHARSIFCRSGSTRGTSF